ncbi:VanZ family protein [Streptomyces bacillaris]|uniref:VanZ family protein n=1 Tax=unclassified Streptomyces TaxID=2593676 RepID=UPI0004907015|nr:MULTISPECIES: VanZ family protein [unclassified Streptomyces]MYT93185.1 VanZ family protein [Streptomyces sp. SID8359]
MTVLTVVLLGLVAFSVLLAKVTLTPSPASADIVTSNLQPGRSLRQYAEDYTFLAACKQAGGNILLGVPFGLLLPFLVPRRLRMVTMTLLTAALMVIVELVQGALVTGRAFDIDDVILNTTGALLGYFLLGRRLSHRYHVYAHPSPAEAARAVPEPRTSEPETPETPEPKARDAKTPGAKTPASKAAGSKAGEPKTAKPKATDRTGTKTLAASGTGARGAGGRPVGDAAKPGSGRALLNRIRRR